MRPQKKQSRRRPFIPWLVLLVLLYVTWSLLKPLPTLKPDAATTPLQLKTTTGALAWPGNQAAAGIVDSSILETNGPQKPLPIASTAKIITSLVVLDKKPLHAGEQGPLITLTDNDAAIYHNYVAQDGSVVPVQSGEKISEYQALQAIMLPSANNMADSLAIWAFGSLENYSKAANAFLATHGLRSTHVGTDASGLSPTTTSTAHDLVLLGKLAMQNQVLAQVVSQETADNIPLVGTVRNVNVLLGTNNIVGIKTGNTDQAGGVFVGAAKVSVDSHPVTIVTAVLGTADLFTAMKNTPPLIKSAQDNFKPVTVLKRGNIIGRYKQPWGGTLAAVATKDVTYNIWNGDTVKATVHLDTISAKTRSGATVGQIKSEKSTFNSAGSAAVKLQDAPTKPSIWWRLEHPF